MNNSGLILSDVCDSWAAWNIMKASLMTKIATIWVALCLATVRVLWGMVTRCV